MARSQFWVSVWGSKSYFKVRDLRGQTNALPGNASSLSSEAGLMLPVRYYTARHRHYVMIIKESMLGCYKIFLLPDTTPWRVLMLHFLTPLKSLLGLPVALMAAKVL